MPAGLTRQDAAQLLYAANVRSVNQRYKLTEPEAIRYAAPMKTPTDREALHLIERLDYQCDCWSEWDGSQAQSMLKKWASHAVHGTGGVL